MIDASKQQLLTILEELRPLATPLLLEQKIAGTEFDTRRIKGSCLFVALRGDKAHGEAFLDAAFSAGAALALVESPSLLESVQYRDRLIIVPDTLIAFTEIARWWRGQVSARILGIAGSIGKTTTKELCKQILLSYTPDTGSNERPAALGSPHPPGIASEKSFNNHIGVPYTLCAIPRSARWAILELGMNHPGELSLLSKLVRPNVALITEIAPEHMEFFASLDEVANAESEVLDGVGPNGTIIYNKDDCYAVAAIARHPRVNELLHLTFGTHKDATARILTSNLMGLEGGDLTLELDNNRRLYKTKLVGNHSAKLLASATLATKTLFPDLPDTVLSSAIADFNPPWMRLNIMKKSAGRVIINDCYNSSPVALQAALEILAGAARENEKRGAILGDMLELGSTARHYHMEAGKQVAALRIEHLITVGPNARYIGEAAQQDYPSLIWYHAESAKNAGEKALAMKLELILVKGSRGIALEQAVATIEEGWS